MTLDSGQRQRLLELGRESIERGLAERRLAPWSDPGIDPALSVERASFTTLKIQGMLRGCCGTLYATRSVAADVWHNAWASAFSDPRFPPLARAEYPGVDLQISVLSPLEPVPVDSERELLATLRPHTDGLVLELDATRATFLPAVWEQLPEPQLFVGHLKQKAGWSPGFWSSRIRAYRYTTESFGAGG
ncbi:MAG TPA: AmmeMemoRadiSam system protein A [Steroidobacteraceae bacterium]|nr:AmmeMemoRadiSam system protein A [Steroidobacteraceae bacterium]